MSVSRNERALVVLSQLTQGVPRDFQWLYRFIESSGRSTASSILGDDYGEYVQLLDGQATKKKFVAKLKTLGAKPSIKAIDVIVMLHGSPNSLVFTDGAVNTRELGDEIAALGLKSKLRMLYSTACFGASHADDFVRAGFSSAIGSVAVNTNAAVEFPPFLTLWALGWQLKDALSIAETPATRLPADQAARVFAELNHLGWANDVNSDKVLIGAQRIKIDSVG